ncbi:MAG TPA: hypothetical protein VI434_14775 [Candidatus Dormibacteraeota bacterium]
MQGFEKWLHAAADEATQAMTVNLHVAHTRRSRYLAGRWATDEGDLYASAR